MLEKTNIEDRLKHQRNKRVSEATLLKEVQDIFQKNNEERETIQARMAEEPQEQETNEFDIDLLKSDPKYAEQIAHEKGYARENETIFYFPANEEN